MRFLRTLTLSATVIGLATATTIFAIGPNEMDDFEDGTVESWNQPSNMGNPTNIPDGGPGGASDNYLEVVSTGTGGPGSRLVVVNEDQWTGNYNAVGSQFMISVDVAYFPPPIPADSGNGPAPLNIRLGVEGGVIPMLGPPEGGRWVSTTAFTLPQDGVWRTATFTLSEAEMTQAEGSGTFTATMDDVNQLRILSAASPAWRGDAIPATLGVDNIQVVSVPVELQSFSID